MDVARILSRTDNELSTTDIADYAQEALSQSNIKTIYILGRRGPAQAAFTNPEIKELGEMEGADIQVPVEEAQLDPLSQAALAEADRTTQKKVEIIQEYAGRNPGDKPKQLILRFLVSPVELIGDDEGQVKAMRLVKNELYQTDSGSLRPRATETFEEIPVQLVFRSVGYRGAPLPDVPFNKSWGVILNEKGRVLQEENSQPLTGVYTSGWIKRGPSGVIGTNKADSVETVICMLEDVAAGELLNPAEPTVEALEALVQERQPNYVSYQDWLRLDALEVERGEAVGRPRLKFTSVEEMLDALGKG
jgi:ferredoxin--NADP+ reductase